MQPQRVSAIISSTIMKCSLPVNEYPKIKRHKVYFSSLHYLIRDLNDNFCEMTLSQLPSFLSITWKETAAE
jgi:hypothetical protein